MAPREKQELKQKLEGLSAEERGEIMERLQQQIRGTLLLISKR